eukprot:11446143-Alexandrium_andersonii.AAC.1
MGVQFRHQLIMPPVCLASTSAHNLLTALHLRMPVSLHSLKLNVGTLAVIVLSDSARSCAKVGRHYRACTTL